MRGIDAAGVERVSRRLGDAALDPSVWTEIMEELCRAVGASGAALLQADLRTPDVPRTAGVDQLYREYFANGWHVRDLRADRGVPLQLGGEKVVIDQDFITPDEMRRDAFYYEALLRLGFQWFAAIGFWAGEAFWALSIQRTIQEGPFDPQDKLLLGTLSSRLTEAATLSDAVGRTVIKGMTDILSLVAQPALVVNRMGVVLEYNSAAERLFDDQIRVVNRHLVLRDPAARSDLGKFIAQLRTMTDTETLSTEAIPVRRDGKRPLLIRLLPIPSGARDPFLGACALLTLTDLEFTSVPTDRLLCKLFGLTPAEARLAGLVGAGLTTEAAAEQLSVSLATVRNQLKAVFAKTDTHRQAELVALMSRLAG